MKVTPIEDAKQFKPFNIVIESQEEADLFTSLIGAATQGTVTAFGVPYATLSDLFHTISPQASDTRPRLCVDLY